LLSDHGAQKYCIAEHHAQGKMGDLLNVVAPKSRRMAMQRSHVCASVLLALASIAAAVGQTPKEPQARSVPRHMIVPLSEMSVDGVVSGNPNTPGAPFVIRIQNDTNFIVPPHWHPQDEHIVVAKGTWYLGMGDRFDRSALREMNVGDYALVPKEMRHFGWSKTETVIQVHGIGPFKVIPDDSWEMLGGWRHTPDDRVASDPRVDSLFKFKLAERVESKQGEGLIIDALRSAKSNIIQYNVQRDDGERFFEAEEELAAVPQDRAFDHGPLTGVWQGMMHGMPDGDLQFKFYVQQNKDELIGIFSSFDGGAAFNLSTFKDDTLEIHIKTPVGNFLFNGKRGTEGILGEWSIDRGFRGRWEAKLIRE
jgi:hypothetical protein